MARHGGGSYLGGLAEALASRAELGLVHLAHPDERAEPPSQAASKPWLWQRSAVYRGNPSAGRWPHRLRMLWRWRRKPLLVAKYWQPEIPGLLRAAREQFRPDVVLVELAQMAQYLPYLQGLPTVLTDHEAGMPANAATGFGARADARDARLWRQYLRTHYPLATRLQALTDEDANSLQAQLDLPAGVRSPTLRVPAAALSPADTPPRALFFGDYRHRPNPEAAERLAREVLPRLRAAEPSTELWLAGPNEQPIAHLDQLEGVRVLGYVPDLRELLAQVRLVLAPLWSGAGFRVKNATALAHGVPIVTNELGSRGCHAPESACFVGESAEQLAAGALRLLRSKELAAEAGSLAHRWAHEHLSADAVAEAQLQRLDAMLAARSQ